MKKLYGHEEKNEIERLLLGHKIVKVGTDIVQLDDGTLLKFTGSQGCSCTSYDLTELNGVDNIITKVDFDDNPGGVGYAEYEGSYRIFVFADNVKVNLATFEGTDGEGYYGTGYDIRIVDRVES